MCKLQKYVRARCTEKAFLGIWGHDVTQWNYAWHRFEQQQFKLMQKKRSEIQQLNFVGWRQNTWILWIQNSIISMLLLRAVREQPCMELDWMKNLIPPVRQGNPVSGQGNARRKSRRQYLSPLHIPERSGGQLPLQPQPSQTCINLQFVTYI